MGGFILGFAPSNLVCLASDGACRTANNQNGDFTFIGSTTTKRTFPMIFEY